MNAVSESQPLKVAVLLPTCNGEKFIDAQIKSLAENKTSFTLHWLDEHSTDTTSDIVRKSSKNYGIELVEWHHPQRQGIPGAFFQLMELAEADIYLFCDQDDIWQSGKIDATVLSLTPDITSPVLCFSDPLIFNDSEPNVFRKLSDVAHINSPKILEETRSFLCSPVIGHTIGFTRPLRDLYLAHKDIARAYAFGHDWWLYLIALSAGKSRMLSGVPTTLYRRHQNNWSAGFFKKTRNGVARVSSTWAAQQAFRCALAKQAKGFVIASSTLPAGPKLERLLALARYIEVIDQRQSITALIRLAISRAMWPNVRMAFWFSVNCLFSEANPSNQSHPARVDKLSVTRSQ